MGAGVAVCVCRVGVKAQGAGLVAGKLAATSIAALRVIRMGCEGEEGDGEEFGELHCGWGCEGVLWIKWTF